ncbi:MAG: ATP phosphoribosyltransferase regulatory subunit, partial [Rhodospirillales bacterium]|nr:ATP phosphoribosyltransferase regulatory subunit [Rhodospirillales bacterium]
MNDKPSKGLLPPGMNDILPPDAAFETATVERLLSVFRGAGYEQVKPPLLEFEDSLLGGAGAAMTQQTFRLM